MTLEHAWKAKAVHLQWAVREWERSYELLESVMSAQQDELDKMKRDLDKLLDQVDRATAEMRKRYLIPIDYLNSDEANAPAPAESGQRSDALADAQPQEKGLLGDAGPASDDEVDPGTTQ